MYRFTNVAKSSSLIFKIFLLSLTKLIKSMGILFKPKKTPARPPPMAPIVSLSPPAVDISNIHSLNEFKFFKNTKRAHATVLMV